MEQVVNIFSSIAVLYNIPIGDTDEISPDRYKSTTEDHLLTDDYELIQPTEESEQNDMRRQ